MTGSREHIGRSRVYLTVEEKIASVVSLDSSTLGSLVLETIMTHGKTKKEIDVTRL